MRITPLLKKEKQEGTFAGFAKYFTGKTTVRHVLIVPHAPIAALRGSIPESAVV